MTSSIPDLMVAFWEHWRRNSPVERGELTRGQYRTLKVLGAEGPMRLKDLSSRIHCTPASASVSVKRLERMGLLVRDRTEVDERSLRIHVTKKTEKSLEGWKAKQEAALESLFDGLEPKEKRDFERLLKKVVDGQEPRPPRRKEEVR